MKPLATPIDFADLVARGILKKAGRGKRSYLLLQPAALPEHASRQIGSIAQTKSGVQITFTDTSTAARAALAKVGRPFTEDKTTQQVKARMRP
jgi:hypothetical protein